MPTHYNVAQEVYFDFVKSDGEIPVGIWTIRIHTNIIVNGHINIWLPTVEEVTNDTAFSRPICTNTSTIPSPARNVISVGGYDSRTNIAANFSGQGNPRDLINTKPDLVAPAVDIITTKKNSGYDIFSGTSMATSFVTGCTALMLEWGIVKGNDHFLYGQKIKAFLRKGANRQSFREYPNIIWGYGTLCLENSIRLLEEYKGRANK